jgi:hypothetical protein
MLKRLFPSKSSRYKHIQNLVKRINTDIIDRLEIFFSNVDNACFPTLFDQIL